MSNYATGRVEPCEREDEWPELFNSLRMYLKQIEESVRSIEDSIGKTEL